MYFLGLTAFIGPVDCIEGVGRIADALRLNMGMSISHNDINTCGGRVGAVMQEYPMEHCSESFHDAVREVVGGNRPKERVDDCRHGFGGGERVGEAVRGSIGAESSRDPTRTGVVEITE